MGNEEEEEEEEEKGASYSHHEDSLKTKQMASLSNLSLEFFVYGENANADHTEQEVSRLFRSVVKDMVKVILII